MSKESTEVTEAIVAPTLEPVNEDLCLQMAARGIHDALPTATPPPAQQAAYNEIVTNPFAQTREVDYEAIADLTLSQFGAANPGAILGQLTHIWAATVSRAAAAYPGIVIEARSEDPNINPPNAFPIADFSKPPGFSENTHLLDMADHLVRCYAIALTSGGA